MKIVILFSLVLLTFKSNSQDKDFKLPVDQNNFVTYEEVISVDSTSKNEMFDRARMYFSKVFKSSKNAIDYIDKESGTIVANGVIPANSKSLGMVFNYGYWDFTYTIIVKDNKYKYTITKFYEKSNSPKYQDIGSIETGNDRIKLLTTPSKGQFKIMKDFLHQDVTSLISILKIQMKVKTNNDF